MRDRELVRALYALARKHPCVNHQENELIRTAADRIRELTRPGCPYYEETIERHGRIVIRCHGTELAHGDRDAAEKWIETRCADRFEECEGYREEMDL